MSVNSSATAWTAKQRWPNAPRRTTVALAARYLGAATVLAAGAEHLQQYAVDNYSVVPTIGTLFVLNFVAAVVLAIGLVAPWGRVSRGYGDAVRAVVAAAGIGFALSSLAGLFVSETSGLFGFVEHGYRTAIVVAIVTEAAAAVCLTLFLLATDIRPFLGRGDRREVSRPEVAGGAS